MRRCPHQSPRGHPKVATRACKAARDWAAPGWTLNRSQSQTLVVCSQRGSDMRSKPPAHSYSQWMDKVGCQHHSQYPLHTPRHRPDRIAERSAYPWRCHCKHTTAHYEVLLEGCNANNPHSPYSPPPFLLMASCPPTASTLTYRMRCSGGMSAKLMRFARGHTAQLAFMTPQNLDRTCVQWHQIVHVGPAIVPSCQSNHLFGSFIQHCSIATAKLKLVEVMTVSIQSASAVQCSAVQCSAVQCSAVQCSAVQCSAVRCGAVQCSTVQCGTVQYSAVQYSTVQCSAVQCSAVHKRLFAVQLPQSRLTSYTASRGCPSSTCTHRQVVAKLSTHRGSSSCC